jgi:hypothetical protein
MAFSAVRTFLLAFIAGGAVSAWGYHKLNSDELVLQRLQIEELEKQQELLEHQIYFLKERQRVAQIEVLEQFHDPESRSGKRTKLRFWEVGEDGQAIGDASEFTIDGDVVYVDAQVIKFDPEFLQENNLEQGSSLLTFRRLFGEFQSPSDGFPLDQSKQPPPAFSVEDNRGGEAGEDFHAELWRNFWQYANRPEVMRQMGVHAMHGEAPYIQLAPAGRYQIELRTTDGLTIRAMD